ncbi:KdelR [Ecytonucleospora hepatopenaei]|uniref:ER lumen protein-retaining receptor n=1 Tax=Ecytonucleospora hepatopenaei TaxID=646526 RepID=A0A1W0E5G9_9MICR|nr:KdelR [Ecytonucleospora hepatopenaei]
MNNTVLNIISSIFCNAAEYLLIAARVIMLRKVIKTRSVSGLSLKTNLLYLITYCLRYLHLRHWFRYSWRIIYANIIKSIFIGYQTVMVFFIFYKYNKTYNKRYDNFPITVLLAVGGIVGLLVTRASFWSYYEELCYNISLVLESVAILPQLVMTQETEDCESMTGHYIITLGLYRACYLIHFVILRMQRRGIDMFMIITALVQTGLYIDFFYVYYSYVFTNKESGINIERKVKEEKNKNEFGFGEMQGLNSMNYTKRV